jgi:MinD superfamily P-loop ATPase
MKIAVLSGKGGTGKTLVAVNIAAVAENAVYVDCDVEEPNGYLFFTPELFDRKEVSVLIPVIDRSICTLCRKCIDFCNFNALACIANRMILFEEVCHSCGGCRIVCPVSAITEKEKVIGHIENGVSKNVIVKTGILNVGETSGIPIIRELMNENENDQRISVFDCPPGSACAVMESIRDADYCILVAEPTIFGIHNLNLVFELVKQFHKPHGVILNKCLEGENLAEQFCAENHIRILGRIPFHQEIGMMSSKGLILVRENETHRKFFVNLLNKVIEVIQNETITCP